MKTSLRRRFRGGQNLRLQSFQSEFWRRRRVRFVPVAPERRRLDARVVFFQRHEIVSDFLFFHASGVYRARFEAAARFSDWVPIL